MKSSRRNTARLAIDIGGTFTDIYLLDQDGAAHTKKTLSSPDDYSLSVAVGVGELLKEANVPADSVSDVLHGTTIVTNTCIELTGAKVGLITTQGFRDVLEISRGRMPRLYDLTWSRPAPLVPRYLRREIDERVDRFGRVVKPLELSEVETVADYLASQGVQSIAICLFNSPLNPIHENQISELIADRYPNIYLSVSTRVMPVIKEYERTCETVVNAYVGPVVSDYMKRLRGRLDGLGIYAPLLIMQSNGGMITAEASAERPVEIVECGPAGGVVGAAYVAGNLGYDNLITLDLGGTTCKASIVEDGRFTRSSEYEVGAGIHMASRLRKGNGYVLRVPSIDIAEIGAGGGSIVATDSGGLLTVGPRSTGADPGPACYDRGGAHLALTDCYLTLGFLNQEHLLAGDFNLNRAKAYEALERVAAELNLDPIEVAYGAYRIANSNMSRAISAVSSERGRDPRKFVLLVFGGAGALHGAEVARGLGIKQVIIAPYAGVFSAFGFTCANIERYWIKGFNKSWNDYILEELNETFDRLKSEAISSSDGWGLGHSDVRIERQVDLRYFRQASELTIPVPEGIITSRVLEDLRLAFDQEHDKTFGHAFPNAPVEAACLRVISTIPMPKPPLSDQTGRSQGSQAGGRTRLAYFGREIGFVDTPVLGWMDLGQKPLAGPLLIDKYDTTIVVPPHCEIYVTAGGCLVINTGSQEVGQ
jgi:N-methylhydantoinase A